MRKVHMNPLPSLHPFHRQREYVRALNATKLERVFARPFIGVLNGHSDGVECISIGYTTPPLLVSGSCDGGRYPYIVIHRYISIIIYFILTQNYFCLNIKN
jgi:hypothetical protein